MSKESSIEEFTRLSGKALGEKIAEETFMKLDVNHMGERRKSSISQMEQGESHKKPKAKGKALPKKMMERNKKDEEGSICVRVTRSTTRKMNAALRNG